MGLIQDLDFIGIPSRDAERARSFYRDVLGMRADGHAEYEQWAGGTCFVVWEPERVGMEFVAQTGNPLPLRVEDVSGAGGARVQGRDVLRRHPRHRCLQHGHLRRPRRQPAHAAPPLRAVRERVAGIDHGAGAGGSDRRDVCARRWSWSASLPSLSVVRRAVGLGSRHRRRNRPARRARPRRRLAPARPRRSRLRSPGRSGRWPTRNRVPPRATRRHPPHHLLDRSRDVDVQADHQGVLVPRRRPGRKIGLDPIDALDDVRSHALAVDRA